jgi:hypothetical protein
MTTAPLAYAATGSDSPTTRAAGWPGSALSEDPPRGDYARGYDDGRQQGVTDGTHDAEVDCSKHKRMSARGAGDYQRGWENGYNNGYEFGYTRTYDQKCNKTQQRKSDTHQFKSERAGKSDTIDQPDNKAGADKPDKDKGDSGDKADKGSHHGGSGEQH